MNSYPKGTNVKCTVVIYDENGALATPGAINFKYRTPETQVLTTIAATLVSTGTYKGYMLLNYPGGWHYGFDWNGVVTGAAEGECCCRESAL